jgi:hypothetical protein
LAVNLGFQLSELTDSRRTTDLVHKALERLPAWRIIPPSADTRQTLNIAADPRLSLLLTVHGPAKEAEGPFELALWDLERGEVFATGRLDSGEKLVTPDTPTGNVFATSIGEATDRTIRIRDLSTEGLRGPGLRIPNVRHFACTDGDWPCYVLHTDGELRGYPRPGTPPSPPIALGRFPSTWGIHVHASGQAVALLGAGAVTWIALRADGTLERSRTFPSLFPQRFDATVSLDDDDATDEASSNVKLRWGPHPQEFLVAVDTGKEHLTVTAVSADSARPWAKMVYKGAPPIHPLVFETAEEGRRFAVAEGSHDDRKEIFHLVELDWEALAKNSSSAVDDRQWTVLGTTEHPLLKSFPAVFAPSGAFLVTASFNFSRGEERGPWCLGRRRCHPRLQTSPFGSVVREETRVP